MRDILPEGTGRPTLPLQDSSLSAPDTLNWMDLQAWTEILKTYCIDSTTPFYSDSSAFYLDRFQHESEQKWTSEKQAIYRYTFKDSIQTFTSFFHWLDCIGEDCQTIQLNEKKRLHPRPAFVLFVSQKELLFVKSQEVKFKSLFNHLKKSNSEILYLFGLDAKGNSPWWYPPSNNE